MKKVIKKITKKKTKVVEVPKCSMCNGTGRHLPEQTCPVCNGAGK